MLKFSLVCNFRKWDEMFIHLHILEEILVEFMFNFINTIFYSYRFLTLFIAIMFIIGLRKLPSSFQNINTTF